MPLDLYQVDAFADTLFSGNPAAVCPLEQWLPDDVMQKIAAENNLAETAFFVPEGDHFHLRWFTPAVEVDLCGHATLATAHVLFEHLNFIGEEIRFQSKSGLLTVKKDGHKLIMDFPTDRIAKVDAPQALLQAISISPQEVWQGREDFLVVLENEAQLADLQPDFRTLLQLGGRGVIATAPGNHYDFVSRCFFPIAGIDEDPVTGSAHTTLTPYWAKRLDKNHLEARQISARGGNVSCTLLGDRVILSGSAITYLQGKIFL